MGEVMGLKVDEARSAGRRACLNGFPQEHPQYGDKILKTAWLEGWAEAKKEKSEGTLKIRPITAYEFNGKTYETMAEAMKAVARFELEEILKSEWYHDMDYSDAVDILIKNVNKVMSALEGL